MFDIIIHADDVVRRRGYCDHFVTMRVCVCVCVCVCVSMIKRKPLIGMTWNHTCNEKNLKLFYFTFITSAKEQWRRQLVGTWARAPPAFEGKIFR